MTGVKKVDAIALLGALQQGYYALYKSLVEAGAVEPGAVADLLRASMEWEGLQEGVPDAMEILAVELDRLDRGGKPRFGVVDGGRED